MNPSSALVNRIWRLCTLLRKDGVTYQQYVNEITYLIFIKMMKERHLEHLMPAGCRWQRLVDAGDDLLVVYKEILLNLRTEARAEGNISVVFSDAATIVRDEKNLKSLIAAIDELPWYDNGRDNFGDIYEGILEKNAEESKRGAGQYFTPRVVVDAIVAAMRPLAGETIQDPAAGTGGFLIGADEYVRQRMKAEGSKPGNHHVKNQPKFVGMENVPDTYRLLLMNLTLHEIETTKIFLGDTLSRDYLKLGRADVILSNPPFGPAGGRPTRTDLQFTGSVSNYQLPFVEHCLNCLNDNGRAAIVVPDNVLFEDGKARELRRHILDEFDLHTVLRLPSGIFYAAGVKTNVLFINRKRKTQGAATWIYDLRTNMPTYGKSTPLRDTALSEFLAFFGEKSDGSNRPDPTTSAAGSRYRLFSREQLSERDDDLDITWLKDANALSEAELTDPTTIVRAILERLANAAGALNKVESELRMASQEMDRNG